MSCVASLRSRIAIVVPSEITSIGEGGSYWKRTLPGFWMMKSPVVLAPFGPTCTKLPDSVEIDDRYVLILAASARWLASKVMVEPPRPNSFRGSGSRNCGCCCCCDACEGGCGRITG